MSAEFWHESSESFEALPQRRLMAYFKGQFADAIEKESAESRRDDDSLNGTFIQRIPLDQGHELTRGSRRIILKPPHPNDIPGYYCEVYALRFEDSARDLPNRDYLENVNHYLLRDFNHGRPGPFWLLDDDGARIVDVADDTIGAIEEYGGSDETATLDDFVIAESMLEKYKGYNIVASAE
jgi:hypothetical protein